MEFETEREFGRVNSVGHAHPQHPSRNEGAAFQAVETALRAKSSLRLKYEAETEVIRRKIGDLESIRSTLGLSQRKMAQLLMVDPSAWTRWTKGGENVPPHIYRMLTWYLALEEKYPALDVNFWLNTVAQVSENSRIPELESHSKQLESKLHSTAQRFDQFLQSHRAEMNLREKRTRSFILWAFAGISMAALSLFGTAILILR